MLEEQALGDYLSALASAKATPGGGAAAGLSGAQASALIAMVCRLTKTHAERTGPLLEAAEQARGRFMALAEQDMDSFATVMDAYRLPKNERRGPLEGALRAAASAPLAMIEEAIALIPVTAELAAIGNPNLATDVGIAAALIDTTVRSARLNVLVNLADIRDPAFAARAHECLERALSRLDELEAVSSAIAARYGA